MSAYAVAHLRSVAMGPPIVEYLQRIDATLAPFGGRFLVHGSEPEVLEGSWPGHLIVIAFPDREQARAWYRSAAYQEILRLRRTTPRATSSLSMASPPGIARRTFSRGHKDECREHTGAADLPAPP